MHINELLNEGDKLIQNLKSAKNLICFGAGSKGVQTLEILRGLKIEPVAFCDNNPKRWGAFINNIPIYGYDEIKKIFGEYSILLTVTIKNAIEIWNDLKEKEEKNKIYFMSNPFKIESKLLTSKDIEEKKELYEQSYRLLEDDKSKEIFSKFIKWKMTGNLYENYEMTEYGIEEFFSKEFIKVNNETVYIDIGAYTGDSICRFLTLGGGYKKIYAIEPDKVNCDALKKFISYARLDDIDILSLGLWSEPGEKDFYSANSLNTEYESSNFFRKVTESISIDKREILQSQDEKGDIIYVNTLDNLFKHKRIDLIKLDVMGSEFPILLGGKNILKDSRPNIIMEYGTCSEFIAETIPYLYSIGANYKFYLRQRESFGNSRTCLYAITE